MDMASNTRGLTYTDVPKLGASIEDIWSFAQMYNGYDACKGLDACADTARVVTRAYKSQGYLLDLDLHHLRSSLFFEQRRYRHMGQMPGETVMAYLNAITHAIRRQVLSASPVGDGDGDTDVDKSDQEYQIDKAFSFACNAHKGVHRKGTEDIPYIIHPVSVALILRKEHASPEVVTAALLHDTVEDTSTSLEDIERGFGRIVRNLVDGASEPDKTATWHERKQHTLEYLRTAPYDVKLLACADKLHNAGSIIADLQHFGSGIWARFNQGRDDQLWYYSGLVDSLRSGALQTGLFDRYAQTVEELVSLARGGV